YQAAAAKVMAATAATTPTIVHLPMRMLDILLGNRAVVLAREQFSVKLIRPEVKLRLNQTLGGTPSPRWGEGGGEGVPAINVVWEPPHPDPLPNGESDCLSCQAVCHGRLSRMMALRMVRSLRATAMSATIFGFPAATRRSKKAFKMGLCCLPTSAPMNSTE